LDIDSGRVVFDGITTYWYDEYDPEHNLEYYQKRTASTVEILEIFEQILKEKTTMRLLNVVAKGIQVARNEGKNYNLDAVFIATELSNYFILEIADVMNNENTPIANMAIAGYNRKKITGIISYMSASIASRNNKDMRIETFRKKDTMFTYIRRAWFNRLDRLKVYFMMAVHFIGSFYNLKEKYDKDTLDKKQIISFLKWTALKIVVYPIIHFGMQFIRSLCGCPENIVNHRDKCLEISSHCTGKGGAKMGPKNFENLNNGMDLRMVYKLDKVLSQPMIKWKKYPFNLDFIKPGHGSELEKVLTCDRNQDKNIKSKGPNFGIYPMQFHRCAVNNYLALCRLNGPVPTFEQEKLNEYIRWYKEKVLIVIKTNINFLDSDITVKDWYDNCKKYVKDFADKVRKEDYQKITVNQIYEDSVKTDELNIVAEKEGRP